MDAAPEDYVWWSEHTVQQWIERLGFREKARDWTFKDKVAKLQQTHRTILADMSEATLSSNLRLARKKAGAESLRIIFLDVDGVLNTQSDIDCSFLEQRPLRLLTTLIQRTRAVVVISSTWRKHPLYMAGLVHAFSEHSLTATCIVGFTPQLKAEFGMSQDRVREIRAWLEATEAPPSRWVALDDLDLGGGSEDGFMTGHFVRTELAWALQEDEAHRAEDMLGGALDTPSEVIAASRSGACCCVM